MGLDLFIQLDVRDKTGRGFLVPSGKQRHDPGIHTTKDGVGANPADPASGRRVAPCVTRSHDGSLDSTYTRGGIHG